MKRINDFLTKHGINRIDRYIIGRFLGTFVFVISLIMMIIVVIDINEKLGAFMRPEVPLKAIAFEYYVSYIPYYANLLAPLFIFITVIFFTSKLASRSEIIAMQAAGMSFWRLARPYLIAAGILSIITFSFDSMLLPRLNRIRINFQNTYLSDQRVTLDENIQLQVAPGTTAYFGTFDANENVGRNFSMEQFDGKTLVSRLTAERITYDSINHWTIIDYRIRNFDGLYEHTSNGSSLDTLLRISPQDLLISEGDAEQMTTSELYSYISQQKERGLANIKSFEVEFHKRFASILAAFILTMIGLPLSFRKVKGGIGLNIAVGLAFTFAYVLLFTVSQTFAIKGDMSPMVAAWFPNLIYIPIAVVLCWRANR